MSSDDDLNAASDAPPEITCSGGIRLPLMIAADDDGE